MIRTRQSVLDGGTTSVVEPNRADRSLCVIPEDATASLVWSHDAGQYERKSGHSYDTITGASNNNVFEDKPWASPSVQVLSRQVGKSKRAAPLVIEGTKGDIIRAVGSARDNIIATNTLSCARADRRVIPTPKPTSRGKPVFGAVYEHRDCFGKPKYIGETSITPEICFNQDTQRHQAVKNLITHQGGRSEVVRTGRSSAIDAMDMQSVTNSIVERRAADLQAEKLKGPKPYSRHGY